MAYVSTDDAPVVTDRWLTGNLKVLSGVSLLQDAASELLYPIMPIFLTVTLGAPAAVVGLVEGIAEAVANLTKLSAGRLGRKYGRRPLIGAGYGLAAVGKAVIAVAFAWPVVLLGRIFDRLGKGIRGPARDSLLVDCIASSAHGRAFGFHRTADTLGAVIGPLIGLAGYELLHHHLRPLLVIAVVPAVLSALLVAAVRDSGGSHARTQPAPDSAIDGPRPSELAMLPSSYWHVVSVLTVFGLVNFADALLLLRLHDIGFSVVTLILAYVGYNLVYAIGSYPAGWLSDRMSRPRIFGVGLLFFAVGYLGLGLTRNHLLAWLVLAAYGLYTACTDGVGKAWVSTMVTGPARTTAQGIAQGAGGLAALVAGLWAGLAWGHDGRTPLLISGIIGAGVALYVLTYRWDRVRDSV